MVLKLKSDHIYLKMCALLNLKVLLMWSEMMLSEFITFALSSSPEIIKKLKKKKIKDSILDVWQDSEYANEYGCKILAKWLLMSTVKHRNKGLYRYENTHVFIAFSFLCLIFQAPRQFFFSFSSLYFIIHVIGTAIVKDVVSF